MKITGYLILALAIWDTLHTIYLFAKNYKATKRAINLGLSYLVKQKYFRRMCWNLAANILIIIYVLGN